LPAWRWWRAEYLVGTGRRVSRRRDDQLVRVAVLFLRDLRRCDDDRTRRRLPRRYPALYLAHALYAGEPAFQRWEVEARLLAGEPWDAVATKCGLGADTVRAYHDLFFDVGDKLPSRDWVANRVLGRRARVGLTDHDTDFLLKIYAFTGGPLAVDALVDYYRNPPVVPQRPELLDAQDREALSTKLLIRASILARTLPADEKALRKIVVLKQAMEMLRGDEDRGVPALVGPLRAALELPPNALAAAAAALDLLAQAVAVGA
jgi:hypothetical protein